MAVNRLAPFRISGTSAAAPASSPICVHGTFEPTVGAIDRPRSRTSEKRSFGLNTSTANSTMNGMLLGRPTRVGLVAAYFVDTAAAMAMP